MGARRALHPVRESGPRPSDSRTDSAYDPFGVNMLADLLARSACTPRCRAEKQWREGLCGFGYTFSSHICKVLRLIRAEESLELRTPFPSDCSAGSLCFREFHTFFLNNRTRRRSTSFLVVFRISAW